MDPNQGSPSIMMNPQFFSRLYDNDPTEIHVMIHPVILVDYTYLLTSTIQIPPRIFSLGSEPGGKRVCVCVFF